MLYLSVSYSFDIHSTYVSLYIYLIRFFIDTSKMFVFKTVPRFTRNAVLLSHGPEE